MDASSDEETLKLMAELASLHEKEKKMDLQKESESEKELLEFKTAIKVEEEVEEDNNEAVKRKCILEKVDEIPEKQIKSEGSGDDGIKPLHAEKVEITHEQHKIIELHKPESGSKQDNSKTAKDKVPETSAESTLQPTDVSAAEFITQVLRSISAAKAMLDNESSSEQTKANKSSIQQTEDDKSSNAASKPDERSVQPSQKETESAAEATAEAETEAESTESDTLCLTDAEQSQDQQYRQEKQPFLQHVPCFKLTLLVEGTPKVPYCRECLRRNNHAQTEADIYCRFQEFRRLQYTAELDLLVAGFPHPHKDPVQEDLNIWQPDEHTEPTAGYMDIQVCRYILLHVGDQFCYLWRQEYEALKLHENADCTIAWKKVVADMREICDVCETTLFNYHWTCSVCGFGVCPDCFRDRKEQRQRNSLNGKVLKQRRGRDAFHWMLCTGAEEHKLAELMLTQIIAADSLQELGKVLHEVRTLWKIPQKCDCQLSRETLPEEPETEIINGIIENMITESRLNQRTALSSLATKETHKQQKRLEKFHRKKIDFARKLGVDYNPGRVFTKETLGKDPVTTAYDCYEHINFLRKGLAGFRRFLPPKVMTMAYSTMLAPNVRHEWLCDGKLLRLTDPMHPDNRILFEEVWKCGQPVMVSEVAQSLDLTLWRPEAFCHDFGDIPNDLINCLNGNLVPNQPMRYFWEGFQCIKKRLLDSHGNPMLLKLKDWPPGDDFAEIMPVRYADLMNGLPLPEYTLRTGNLNIASCLPKLFVPPDLGPKMYNAYGSALHPDKGTTNLHLDISDAANVMVYVGMPQDAESESQIEAAQHAIAMSGCDFLTRLRCQDPNVMPGAIWHIFAARDADKIRDLLNRVTLEKGYRLEPDHDPIHDQSWYLDDELRTRLFEEYGVKGYSIVQCLGDAVFIPAGAPHQVQNLHNCIKVAEDFVSPENITHCYHLTHEFRQLSRSHTNHEDKLQIKNIIYHAVKDCCTILNRALEKKIAAEIASHEQKTQNSDK